jgi:hypothetical protein
LKFSCIVRMPHSYFCVLYTDVLGLYSWVHCLCLQPVDRISLHGSWTYKLSRLTHPATEKQGRSGIPQEVDHPDGRYER